MGRRPHLRGQAGFTLIEVLVSITLLTSLGVMILAAADVGVHTLGRGGAGARAAGAHDISAFEQVVSADVARSQCVALAGSAYGTCVNSVNPGALISQCRGTTFLCTAWIQLTGSATGCHIAAYSQPKAGSSVLRQEYLMQSGSPVLQGGSRHVTTVSDGVTVSLSSATFTTSSGIVWVSRISLTVTDASVAKNPPTATMVMRPLTADPGANAARYEWC